MVEWRQFRQPDDKKLGYGLFRTRCFLVLLESLALSSLRPLQKFFEPHGVGKRGCRTGGRHARLRDFWTQPFVKRSIIGCEGRRTPKRGWSPLREGDLRPRKCHAYLNAAFKSRVLSGDFLLELFDPDRLNNNCKRSSDKCGSFDKCNSREPFGTCALAYHCALLPRAWRVPVHKKVTTI